MSLKPLKDDAIPRCPFQIQPQKTPLQPFDKKRQAIETPLHLQ